MLDKAEADAVFALPEGGVSDVLKSQFGPVIVRVKSITPSTSSRSRRSRTRSNGRFPLRAPDDKIQALHDKIEDARVSGKSLMRRPKPSA